MSRGITIWRYRRRFRLDHHHCEVVLRSRSNGLFSELLVDGVSVARDHTPTVGIEAIRNHALANRLADGSELMVEAGYISAINTGIAVFRNGVPVHESHPGRKIAYPEAYREAAVAARGESAAQMVKDAWKEGWDEGAGETGVDMGVWKRNWIPLSVDIALGLLFFLVAKLTDLTTAALVGAAVGILLLLVQRLTKIDLLGGLAMFGIVMLLLSAGLALLFQSDEAVKYRSTAIGTLSALLFFADGLAGGKYLARRLMNYLPYTDIDAARLGIGMGLLGLVMATANLAVALLASTDVWLFYTTFADFALTMVLVLLVFRYARGQMLPNHAPAYSPVADDG